MSNRLSTVHVNGRCFFSDHPTGTHRSAENFIRALLGTKYRDTVQLWASAKWPRAVAFGGQQRCELRETHTGSTLANHLWEQSRFPRKARDGVAVSLIGTGPVFAGRARHLMFVHDLHSLIDPALFSPSYRLWSRFAKYAAIRRADHLVCFTYHVKQDVCNRLGVAADRISVIRQGPGIAALELPQPDQTATSRRHFLCVGSLQPHKNLARILEAWRSTDLAGKGIELLIVGKPQRSFGKSPNGTTAETPGARFTGYIDDVELARIYRTAIAVVYPSLHEGFGLPIAEAYCAGTPVITSNRSCLPEVAGDAALLVDPESTREIAAAMGQLAGRGDVWARLHENTRALRETFSWAKAGEQLARVLDELAPMGADSRPTGEARDSQHEFAGCDR